MSQGRQIQETVLGRDYRKESVWVSESWATTRDCRDPYQATRVSKTFGPSRSVECQSPGPELIDLRGRCHLKSTERFASGRVKGSASIDWFSGKNESKTARSVGAQVNKQRPESAKPSLLCGESGCYLVVCVRMGTDEDEESCWDIPPAQGSSLRLFDNIGLRISHPSTHLACYIGG